MKLDTLEALLIDELKDLWSAEKQILAGLPKMIKAAGARTLKKAFVDHMGHRAGAFPRLSHGRRNGWSNAWTTR